MCAPLPPFVLSRVRALALRGCGARLGRGSIFWGLPTLLGQGDVGHRLRVGRNCGFNVGCVFDLQAPITIGDRVSVGHQVRFLTGESTTGRLHAADARPITIGDGAWLGARCTVLAGVTIGAGAVVGAGVTVADDVPAQMLVNGTQRVSLARWR
jgi:acetyltransferase-like isoleucine patch superfamily enzyme